MDPKRRVSSRLGRPLCTHAQYGGLGYIAQHFVDLDGQTAHRAIRVVAKHSVEIELLRIHFWKIIILSILFSDL